MAGDTLFGVHGAALQVRGARMGVLASNIANASTPGFKARDIDFQAALASMEASTPLRRRHATCSPRVAAGTHA